ncbi:MAG: hypothetical protein NXI31_11320 [bacterium]|nr:hypothetical protein [bacterium]
MPIDYQTSGPLIRVRNRGGITQPFATGMLATSVLVTGVATPLAFELAASIADDLRRRQIEEISSDELVERTALELEVRVGAVAGERFRAWHAARASGRPLVLGLWGAPGVGKSGIGNRVALRLGVDRVVPTDAIRETLRTVVPESVLPELHLAAHAAWIDPAAPGSDSPFVRQAQAVGGAVVAALDRMTRDGRSVLVAGAHCLPGDLRAGLAERGSNAVVVELLLTLDDERLHRARMLRRARSAAARPGARHLDHFPAIRELQCALVEQARSVRVPSYDVAGFEGLVEGIVDRYVAEAAPGGVVVGADHA